MSGCDDESWVEYDSGFKWVRRVLDGVERFDLSSPCGGLAATAFLRAGGGYSWYVWDEDGGGGENSSAETLEAAMIEAESAVLRCGCFY